jgi:uncharacterized protein with PQ loop repeat
MKDLFWHFSWICISGLLIWLSLVNLIAGSESIKSDTGILVVNAITLLLRIPLLERPLYGEE